MRVLLATDRPDLGHALSLFLSERRIVVLGVIDDADALLERALECRPDAVLVDWRLGDETSTRMVAALAATDVPTPAVVLTTTQERCRARTCGAAAYATLGDPPDELLSAIHAAAGGAPRSSGQASA